MFQSNGIDLSKQEIQCFFDLCHSNSKGYLTFDEFKTVYKDPEADRLFRFFIKRARKMNDELYGEGVNSIYLPFNLSSLLEHMSLKARRETLISRIQGDSLSHERVEETLKNFLKLFIINKGQLETISKDEWSRKINAALIQRDYEERKANGEKINLQD